MLVVSIIERFIIATPCSNEQQVLFWDSRDMRVPTNSIIQSSEQGMVTCIQLFNDINHNASSIALGCEDGSVHVYDSRQINK